MWTLHAVQSLSSWGAVEAKEREIAARWEWLVLSLRPVEYVAETVENARRVLGVRRPGARVIPGWGNA